MKRCIPIIALLLIAALSPAPIKDTRKLVKQPELSDAERAKQQNGAQLGTVGSVPDRTERIDAPPITGDADASRTIRSSGEKGFSDSSQRGADAIKTATKDLAREGKPNFGRMIGGLIMVIAALGLFQVFRMWANKALPDAPANFK